MTPTNARLGFAIRAPQVGDDLPYLSWISPSPDGRVLAIDVCTDGSEQNTIRLIDIPTGRPVDGATGHVLHDAWTGGAVWLPDYSGFYFIGLVGPVDEFRQAVFLHRLSAPPPEAAQGGDAPILLRVWDNVGHGWATEKSVALEQGTEWLAFLLRTLDAAPDASVVAGAARSGAPARS